MSADGNATDASSTDEGSASDRSPSASEAGDVPPDFHAVRARAHTLLGAFGADASESSSADARRRSSGLCAEDLDEEEDSVERAMRAVDSMMADIGVDGCDEERGGNVASAVGGSFGGTPAEVYDLNRSIHSASDSISELSVHSAKSSVSGMSADQQSAMEEFLSNPSDMKWEDLVKSMKKQRRRSSSGSKGSKGSRGSGRGRRNNARFKPGRFELDLSTIIDEAISKNLRTLVWDDDEEAIEFDVEQGRGEPVCNDGHQGMLSTTKELHFDGKTNEEHPPRSKGSKVTLMLLSVLLGALLVAGCLAIYPGRTQIKAAAPEDSPSKGEIEAVAKEVEEDIQALAKETDQALVQAASYFALDGDEESDLLGFCDDCKWQDTAMTCLERVQWEMTEYQVTEAQAKMANLEHCVTTRSPDFCGQCLYKDTGVTCEERAEWEMERKDLCRVDAEAAILADCMGTPPAQKGDEEESDPEGFCGECTYGDTDLTCSEKVQWEMEYNGLCKTDALSAIMADCAPVEQGK